MGAKHLSPAFKTLFHLASLEPLNPTFPFPLTQWPLLQLYWFIPSVLNRLNGFPLQPSANHIFYLIYNAWLPPWSPRAQKYQFTLYFFHKAFPEWSSGMFSFSEPYSNCCRYQVNNHELPVGNSCILVFEILNSAWL